VSTTTLGTATSRVATYLTELPPKSLLEKKLRRRRTGA
jgi:hypothetical protein